MRAGRASFTAQVVAFARGLASLSSPAHVTLDDSLARELLPAPLSTVLGAASLSPLAAHALRSVIDASSGNLVEHMALRTLAIDDAVRAAVERGTRQLVLLGAGLDVRAYRLEFLREVTVFEVDHPDTQREKQRGIAHHAPLASEVRHVPVDFARDSLEAALADAGHDANALTCWVWEGVTMYLPLAATRDTLAALSARSAAGSRLAVTYVDSSAFEGPGVRAVTQALFRVLGESLHGLHSIEELARLLDDADFDVRSDTGNRDWRIEYSAPRPLLRAFDGERLAIAEKR